MEQMTVIHGKECFIAFSNEVRAITRFVERGNAFDAQDFIMFLLGIFAGRVRLPGVTLANDKPANGRGGTANHRIRCRRPCIKFASQSRKHIRKMKQFRTSPRLRPVLLFALILLASGSARAGCSNPTASERDMIYNGDYHTYQFCNGTNWQAFGGGKAASGGLFNGLIAGPPTQASTGLSSTFGDGSSPALTDTSAGVLATATGSSGIIAGAKTASVPATPYSITVLLASAEGVPMIGWTDGTKVEAVFASAYTVNVQANSNAATFASTVYSKATSGLSNSPVWLKIRDDGTNVYFAGSGDGVNFFTFYSVAKSSGYLGASGYSHIVVSAAGGGAGAGPTDDVTVMSWSQGS